MSGVDQKIIGNCHPCFRNHFTISILDFNSIDAIASQGTAFTEVLHMLSSLLQQINLSVF